jgi:serine/threonine protein kinase
MHHLPIDSSDLPAEICGYRIIGVLHPGRTYLALAPPDRKIVLKVLQNDCLARGRLHASVRQRLQRIQQLPHSRVANFHGVEKNGDTAYLIWDYIDGISFDDKISYPDLLLLVSQLVLAVDSLHSLGIVHGNLHARNIIIDAAGNLKLTDVSPLLYDDPAQDVLALLQLLQGAVTRANERDSPLGRVLTAVPPNTSLRQLASRLGGLRGVSADQRATALVPEHDSALRRNAIFGALAAILAAGGIFLAMQRLASKSATLPPPPPQAPLSALQPATHPL